MNMEPNQRIAAAISGATPLVSGTLSECSSDIADLRKLMSRWYGEETAKCVRSEEEPASHRVLLRIMEHLQKFFSQRRRFAEMPAEEMDPNCFCHVILNFFKSLTDM